VAAGHAGLITADSVKQGVVLVDVGQFSLLPRFLLEMTTMLRRSNLRTTRGYIGINHVPDSSRKSGYRLVGDCTDEAYGKASRYTPVPGGIGRDPHAAAIVVVSERSNSRLRRESCRACVVIS
jgi:5,10-methylene-tetrahydrofolate dehydrogenase/methenyl tetrahydrofolate cyclohydrolase